DWQPEAINDGTKWNKSSFSEFSDPNPTTGAFATSVPISLPPGPGGLAPSLGLSYSSDGGPGLAGKGWSLTTDCIERQGPSKTVPRMVGGANQPQTIYSRGPANPVYTDNTHQNNGWSDVVTTADVFYLNGERLIPLTNNAVTVGATGTFSTEHES